MTVSWWTVIKAVIVLLPQIITMVREGRIKTAAQDEVLEALASKWDSKIREAEAARQAAKDRTDWSADPNDRANWP